MRARYIITKDKRELRGRAKFPAVKTMMDEGAGRPSHKRRSIWVRPSSLTGLRVVKGGVRFIPKQVKHESERITNLLVKTGYIAFVSARTDHIVIILAKLCFDA
jgi:hypothetical protein